jgi:hypothetical protein
MFSKNIYEEYIKDKKAEKFIPLNAYKTAEDFFWFINRKTKVVPIGSTTKPNTFLYKVSNETDFSLLGLDLIFTSKQYKGEFILQ